METFENVSTICTKAQTLLKEKLSRFDKFLFANIHKSDTISPFLCHWDL